MTDDKIVDLSSRRAAPEPPPVAVEEDDPDRVWQCANCHHQTFYLYEDGRAECAACGKIGEKGHWHERFVPDDSTDPGFSRERTSYDVPELAKVAVLKDGRLPGVEVVIIAAPEDDDFRLRIWWGAADQHSEAAAEHVDLMLARIRGLMLTRSEEKNHASEKGL